MIIDSSASDIIYTAAVSGVNANFLKKSLESVGITEDLWNQSKKIDFGELSHSEKEAQAWKTIWSAGQGVTSINDVMKTSKLIERLKNEFKESLMKQSKLLKKF